MTNHHTPGDVAGGAQARPPQSALSRDMFSRVTALWNLSRAAARVADAAEAALFPVGISLSEFVVLRAVSEHRPVSVAALTAAIDETALCTEGTVWGLSRKEWLATGPQPDRTPTVTAAGEQALAAGITALAPLDAAVEAAVPDAVLITMLLTALERITTAGGAADSPQDAGSAPGAGGRR